MPGQLVRSINQKGASGAPFDNLEVSSTPLFVDLVVGAAGVEFAVGAGFEAVAAAEIEFLGERVADGPFAGAFAQLQQAQALSSGTYSSAAMGAT